MTRGKQKITADQKALLERGKASYAAWMEASDNKARRLAALEAELDAEIEGVRVRWAIDAHTLRQAGVPVTHIAKEILGHEGTTAAYAAINEGERYATRPAQVDEQATETVTQRFERMAGGVVRFTPAREELEIVLEKIGLIADAAPVDAEFKVRDGIITPMTPRTTPDGFMHPVVALVMADGSKVGRELVEFAARAA